MGPPPIRPLCPPSASPSPPPATAEPDTNRLLPATTCTFGFTIGSSKSTHDLRENGTTQSQSFSTVGSTGGNVDIAAGNQLHVGGADLVAGKNMALTGDSVTIEPGHDRLTSDQTFKQKSSGLTIALSGAVGDAVNTAASTAMAVKDQSWSPEVRRDGHRSGLSPPLPCWPQCSPRHPLRRRGQSSGHCFSA